MQFERQGMRGAQPVFQVYQQRAGEPWEWSGVMTKAEELAVREVDYRDDIVAIDHPDAKLIALAPQLAELALQQRLALERIDGIYEGLRTDANDGEFALWTEDDLVAELHKVRALLRRGDDLAERMEKQ